MKPVQGPKINVLAYALADQNEQILVPSGVESVPCGQSARRGRSDKELTLDEIEAALRRLNNGTYGLCSCCGVEIDLPRLEANPITTVCVDCEND
ncbi:MAG: TraR/DksA C4-type zinc finger protein [Pseudomonadota bacterium]